MTYTLSNMSGIDTTGCSAATINNTSGIDRPGNGNGATNSPVHVLLGSANIQKLWSNVSNYYFVIDSNGQAWTWSAQTPYGLEGQSVLVNPYNEVSGYGQGAFFDPDSQTMVY